MSKAIAEQPQEEVSEKMTVMIVSISKLVHNQSESSRKWYISNALNKYGIPTIIVGKKSESGDDIVGDNVIAVRQILQGFIGSLLLRVQVSLVALKVILSEKVDKVIVRGCDLPLLALFIKVFRKKMIYDFHGYLYKEEAEKGRIFKSEITRIFDLFMLIMADYIIAVSEGTRNQLPKKYLKKTTILPNGVDLELFKGEISDKEKDELKERYDIPKDKKIVGFVGALSMWFNFDDLVGATDYLDEYIHIVVIGDGVNYAGLKKKTVNNNKISLLGRLPHKEVLKLLNSLICVCIAPYNKNWFGASETGFFHSRKVTEYLAAGKPIICSNIIGIPSFLTPNENVLLYEPNNPKDLASKIRKLLNDEQLYKKMSENNKKLSEEFSWESLVEKSGLVDILRREK